MKIDKEDIRLLGRLTARVEQHELYKLLKGPNLKNILEAVEDFDLDFIKVNQRLCPNIRYRKRVCEKCMRFCPVNAIDIDDGKQITIDESTCLKCGICGPVCPVGVFEPNEPSDSKMIDEISNILSDAKIKQITFECNKFNGLYGNFQKNELHKNSIILPCLARISEPMLLKTYALGADDVKIGNCDDDCTCGQGKEAYKQMKLLHEHLFELFSIGKDNYRIEIEHAEKSSDGSDQEYNRRDFVTEVGKKTIKLFNNDNAKKTVNVDNLIQRVPLNRADTLKFVENLEHRDYIVDRENLPFAELVIDSDKCDSCGVCSALCPTGAMGKLDLDEISFIYFSLGKCTACDLCIKSCHKNAVTMNSEVNLGKLNNSAEVLVKHKLETCPVCGTTFIKLQPEDNCQKCENDNSLKQRLQSSLVDKNLNATKIHQ